VIVYHSGEALMNGEKCNCIQQFVLSIAIGATCLNHRIIFQTKASPAKPTVGDPNATTLKLWSVLKSVALAEWAKKPTKRLGKNPY